MPLVCIQVNHFCVGRLCRWCAIFENGFTSTKVEATEDGFPCYPLIGSPENYWFLKNFSFSHSCEICIFGTGIFEDEEDVSNAVLSLGTSEDTISRHEYQENACDTYLGSGEQCKLLPFSEGEAAAVTTTQRDLQQAATSIDVLDLIQQFQKCVLDEVAVSGGDVEPVQNYGITISDADQDAKSPAESKHIIHLSEVAPESQQQPKGSVRKRSTPPTASKMSPPQKLRVSKACALSLEQKHTKKWTDKETSELISVLVGGHFRRGKRGGMRWDDVNIEDAEGRRRTKSQCQNRNDVLLKAYKTMKDYIDEHGKSFSEITEKERCDMKLATPLRKEWYMDLDKFYCQRWPDNAKSSKRAKLNPGVDSGPS